MFLVRYKPNIFEYETEEDPDLALELYAISSEAVIIKRNFLS